MSRRKEIESDLLKEDLKEKLYQSVIDGDTSSLGNILADASPHQRKTWFVPYIDRNTLLHIACQRGHIRVLRTLVQYYGDDSVHRVNRSRQTPLHVACEFGFTRIVKALIEEYGCSPSTTDINGNTALHYAARHGGKDLAKYLVQKGSPINYLNKQKETPLHLSIERSHIDFSKELINLGASTTLKNNEGKTVVDIAHDNGISSRFNFQKMETSSSDRKNEKSSRNIERGGESSKKEKEKDKGKEREKEREKEKEKEKERESRKRKGKEKVIEEEIEFHCPESEPEQDEDLFHKRLKGFYTFSDAPLSLSFGGNPHINNHVFYRISQDLESEAIEWEQEPMFSRVDAIHVRYER